MVRDPIPAGHKDHGCRTPLACVDTVVPSPARHVPEELLVAQDRLRSRPHRGYAVLVEQHSRAFKVRLPGDGERQPFLLALRGGPAFAVDGLPLGEGLEVALQVRLDGLDGCVGRGAYVEGEADVARDRVDAAWGKSQDARRSKGRVFRSDAVGVGYQLGCEEQGVGAGGEGGGACV